MTLVVLDLNYLFCFFMLCWILWIYQYYIIMSFSYETYADSSAFRGNLRLAPMPDSYDLDRGLLLSVQAIQVANIKKCLTVMSIYATSHFIEFFLHIFSTPFFLQALLENNGFPVIVGIGNMYWIFCLELTFYKTIIAKVDSLHFFLFIHWVKCLPFLFLGFWSPCNSCSV